MDKLPAIDIQSPRGVRQKFWFNETDYISLYFRPWTKRWQQLSDYTHQNSTKEQQESCELWCQMIGHSLDKPSIKKLKKCKKIDRGKLPMVPTFWGLFKKPTIAELLRQLFPTEPGLAMVFIQDIYFHLHGSSLEEAKKKSEEAREAIKKGRGVLKRKRLESMGPSFKEFKPDA